MGIDLRDFPDDGFQKVPYRVGMRGLGLLLSFVLLGSVVVLKPATAQESCRIERVTYRVDGLQFVGWIMKPAREDRFPVIVWSHGARFATAGAQIINENTPCPAFVLSKRWMLLFTQTRGYGGSEGQNPEAAFRQAQVAFLNGRADDINRSVEWLRTRSDVNADCIANMAWSQGAVTALLASGKKPALYRATIAQAPVAIWAPDLNRFVGFGDVIQAARDIQGPILMQSNTIDEDSFVEVTRVLVRELQRWGKSVEYREYTHPSAHQFFNLAGRPELAQMWGAEAVAFLERAFAGCGRPRP
ncbi:MAG: alpha/beta hydrolase family protein [Armatimonadota bacterium]